MELAAVHTGLNELCGDTVAVAASNGRLFPSGLLLTSSRRKRNGTDSQHHEQSAADDFQVDGKAPAVQFSENKNPPQQAPQLIRIGKRNAAADAHVFCSILLEDVANHPDEAAKHQPENDAARAEQFLP